MRAGAAASLMVCVLIAAVAVHATQAKAEDYPTRPIRIVVGPSPDIFSRIIADID